MTRDEGSALFLMWAYWDHPHTPAPGCPLISSKGQPFLSSLNAVVLLLCLCLSSATYLVITKYQPATEGSCFFFFFSPDRAVASSNFVSNTSFSFFLHPSKKKSYYCLGRSRGELVTSVLPLGLPPLWALALFQAALFHLNFNPIYGLSFPLARPGLSNYSSSGLHVTRPLS